MKRTLRREPKPVVAMLYRDPCHFTDPVLATVAVAVRCEQVSEEEIAKRLRRRDPAVMGRVENGQVLLDLRAVFPGQDQSLADAVSAEVT